MTPCTPRRKWHDLGPAPGQISHGRGHPLHPGKVSLFEPIHGSAPKHAGKGVASPVAAILAAGMMLDYICEPVAGKAIEDTIRELICSGQIKGVKTGAHPTAEVGDMVAKALRASGATV